MTNAALYLVRAGTITIEEAGQKRTVGSGGYFGEDQLKADIGAGADFTITSPAFIKPKYTAKAGAEEVTVGVLTLKACRQIMDTRHIGDPLASANATGDSIVNKAIALDQLEKHTILGAGTFGQASVLCTRFGLGILEEGQRQSRSDHRQTHWFATFLFFRYGWSRVRSPMANVLLTH